VAQQRRNMIHDKALCGAKVGNRCHATQH